MTFVPVTFVNRCRLEILIAMFTLGATLWFVQLAAFSEAQTRGRGGCSAAPLAPARPERYLLAQAQVAFRRGGVGTLVKGGCEADEVQHAPLGPTQPPRANPMQWIQRRLTDNLSVLCLGRPSLSPPPWPHRAERRRPPRTSVVLLPPLGRCANGSNDKNGWGPLFPAGVTPH